jgi:hypothetical protein
MVRASKAIEVWGSLPEAGSMGGILRDKAEVCRSVYPLGI